LYKNKYFEEKKKLADYEELKRIEFEKLVKEYV